MTSGWEMIVLRFSAKRGRGTCCESERAGPREESFAPKKRTRKRILACEGVGRMDGRMLTASVVLYPLETWD